MDQPARPLPHPRPAYALITGGSTNFGNLYDLIVPLNQRELERLIVEVVEKSFFKYFSNRKPIDTHHILLSRLYPKESVIGSAVVGLQTSLGTTLWESLAKKLAVSNDFKSANPKEVLLEPSKVPREVEDLIGEWSRSRENATGLLLLDDFREKMREVVGNLSMPSKFKTMGKGAGADIYLIKKNKKFVIDVKTVQINAGSGPKFNRTLMSWIAFDMLKNGATSNLTPMIAIPYDPTKSKDWWQKFGGRVSPLDGNDVKVGDEFWDWISGFKGTLKVMEGVFDELVKTDFGKHYADYLTDYGLKARVAHIEHFHRCKLIGDLSKVKDAKTKYLWSCSICEKSVSLTINKILALETGCVSGESH